LVALGLAGPASAQNLIINGGFETGSFPPWVQSGNTGFTSLGQPAHTGNFAVQAGPVGSLGFISQTIPTIPGGTYDFQFWELSDGGTPNAFQASFGSNMVLNLTNDPAHPYQLFDFSVTATGSSTTVTFGFRNDPGFLSLDDVSVRLTAIPEPSTLLLTGMGLLSVVPFVRRKRAKVA
jgi:flagellin